MTDPLPVVDGRTLSRGLRDLLRPGEEYEYSPGMVAPLPCFFYQVDSWEKAKAHKLTVHFTLAELMVVDCREARPLLQAFPHYVPCTVSVLARYLETFRERVEAPVHVTINGGYRSPAHEFSHTPSLHPWATAVEIYRIGDHWLDDEKSIERFGKIAAGIGQEIAVAPFGHKAGETDDHLHLDLGLITAQPDPRRSAAK